MLFLCGHVSNFLWSSFEDFVVFIEVFIDFKNGSTVAASVAVIRCTPHSYELVVEDRIVALHHQLMSPRNETQIVLSIEFLNYICTKEITSTSSTDLPAKSVSIRITPHEVAHWPVLRHFLLPIECPNLIKCAD
jgi:hypothetical protein